MAWYIKGGSSSFLWAGDNEILLQTKTITFFRSEVIVVAQGGLYSSRQPEQMTFWDRASGSDTLLSQLRRQGSISAPCCQAQAHHWTEALLNVGGINKNGSQEVLQWPSALTWRWLCSEAVVAVGYQARAAYQEVARCPYRPVSSGGLMSLQPCAFQTCWC